MKFRTHYNRRYTDNNPLDYETNQLPSKTIPNDSLTIAQIYERYAKGKPLSVHQYTPIYDGEDVHLPDLRKLDIEEIHQFTESAKQNFAETQQRYKNEQAENLNKRVKAAAQKIIDDAKKSDDNTDKKDDEK